MYISGHQGNFQARLHQLPTGLSDLMTGFLLEGRGWSGVVPKNQNISWNKEFNKKWENLTSEPMATGRWFY